MAKVKGEAVKRSPLHPAQGYRREEGAAGRGGGLIGLHGPLMRHRRILSAAG